MRIATHDQGWLTDETTGQLQGFSLGYDYCAEHERGVPFLKQQLGIKVTDFPQGVEDRTMTQVPEILQFLAYDYRPKDKRFKKTAPAAILHCTSAAFYAASWYADSIPAEGAALAKWLDVDFYACCFSDKWYEAKRHDIMSSWSETGGFALHVRGQENVDKLKALHAAMLDCKVSLADPSTFGFTRRALALMLCDAISPEVRAVVLAADQAHLKLHQAAEATGVEAALKAAGRRTYALSPAWRDEEGSDIIFYLNPYEQNNHRSGWFTVPELLAWTQGNGPVMEINSALRDAFFAVDPDYEFCLIKGLELSSIYLRTHSILVALDEEKQVPGARLMVAKKSQGLMPDGVYSLEQLRPFIEAGRSAKAAAPKNESIADAATPAD